MECGELLARFRLEGNSGVSVLEQAWRRSARQVTRRINLGWWLEAFLPLLLSAALLCSLLSLLIRRTGAGPRPALCLFAAALPLLALAALLRTRGRWLGPADAFVRLDRALAQQGRLLAAAEGVIPWPAAPEISGDGSRLVPSRILPPLGLSALCLALGLAIPVHPVEAPAAPQALEPLSWAKVEETVKRLEGQELFDRQAFEEAKAQLEALRSQPKEDWYSHDSLEAGDALAERTARGLSRTARELLSARRALEALSAVELQATSAAERARLAQSFEAQVLALEQSAFALDPKLMQSLKSLDARSVRALSAAELAARLGQGAEQILGALGESGAGERSASLPGPGDVSRGPGSAPLRLGPEQGALGGERTEAVSGRRSGRDRSGDVVGVDVDQHPLRPQDYRGLGANGAPRALGEGGDVVWRSSFVPEEQDFLRRYFQ